MPPQSFT
jgi:hypothetical protein